jgi:DNA-binding beta-propeller fold protein YncE
MLRFLAQVALPPGQKGGFDHGDGDLATGRVYVAHTAFGTLEVIDGKRLTHATTLSGCPEGSGVLCAQEERLVFAASRGAGKVLVISADTHDLVREIGVGPRPNGLAWDPGRRRLLVADVDPGDQFARLIEVESGLTVGAPKLPGRPRWCVYDAASDRFLVNIREPAQVVALSADSGQRLESWPVASAGPHGLDLDPTTGRALVACDGGHVITIDLESGREVGRVAIAGEPDAIWFNPARKALYVAIGKRGLVQVVDTEKMDVSESIPTGEGAHTTAFDRQRQRVYVFLPETCSAAVYEEA